MKYFLYSLLMFSILFACNDEKYEETDIYPFPGEKVMVKLELKVKNELNEKGEEITPTRAPVDVIESQIHNVWVFQFDRLNGGTDDKERKLIWYYYLDRAQLTAGDIPLIDSDGEQHLLAFIANTNNKSYSWGLKPGTSTYADLLDCHIDLSNKEEAITYGHNEKNLVMSGMQKTVITKNATLSGVELIRSLAKIKVNLTIQAAGYKVVAARACNVSNRFDLTDALKEYNSQSAVPAMPESTTYPYMENATTGFASTGNPGTLVWYVPRNTRGKNQNTDPAQKNRYAPEFATYIEVLAINTTKNNEGVVYRIYPGADHTSDFNIVPNHQYTTDLEIRGNGGETITDSRIEQYGTVRFPGNNNSFILNPPTTEAMGARTFEIPITRVNEYWRPTNTGYGGRNNDIILPTTNWKVDLLWQDHAGIIRDITDGTKLPTHVLLNKSKGKGTDETATGDGYFSITVPYGATHGNFVIVLRLDDGNTNNEVLWSWHFWVTDYNPNQQAFIEPKGDQFVYDVPGGQVERYGGTIWGYDTEGSAKSNNWNNYAYNTSSTQPYTRKFMMDRPLGSLDNHSYVGQGRGNIAYQYGRKDPYPAVYDLYKIDGTPLTSEAPETFKAQYWNKNNKRAIGDGFNSMADLVRYPLSFYNSGSLSDLKNETLYLWHDSKIVKANNTAKSIYDPCPPGWQLPAPTTWADFTVNQTTNIGNAQFRDFKEKSYVWGLMYWPFIEKDGNYPLQNKIYYPFIGYRWHGDLAHRYSNGAGTILYTNTPALGFSSHNDSSGYTGEAQVYTRGNACSVRCVSQ